MWDKTRLLRIAASALFAISLTLLAIGVTRYVLQLPVFKLRTVQLTDAPRQVDLDQLNRVSKLAVGGSFFTVDLEKTRRMFEQLPWVRKVSVRRHFPWGLEVTLEEHVALARWNGTALVNTYGEVFAGQSNAALPEFNGEPDTSAQVTEMYRTFNQQLAVLQRSVAEISLSSRFAWQLKLDNGMQLELGREQVKQRMARFVAVYPYSLATLKRNFNHVDLRYRNGFAASELASAGTRAGMKIDSRRNSGSRV